MVVAGRRGARGRLGPAAAAAAGRTPGRAEPAAGLAAVVPARGILGFAPAPAAAAVLVAGRLAGGLEGPAAGGMMAGQGVDGEFGLNSNA